MRRCGLLKFVIIVLLENVVLIHGIAASKIALIWFAVILDDATDHTFSPMNFPHIAGSVAAERNDR